MTPPELARRRLYAQHIVATRCRTPGEVVAALGAVQAQDYAAAKYFRDFCIWGTVIITIGSGLLYIQRAIGLYRKIDPPLPIRPDHSAPDVLQKESA